jgi:hypothetical protein
MSDSTLEKEILIMKLKVYKRVKVVKKERIFKELKKFRVVKSIIMFGNWLLIKKIK